MESVLARVQVHCLLLAAVPRSTSQCVWWTISPSVTPVLLAALVWMWTVRESVLVPGYHHHLPVSALWTRHLSVGWTM